MNRRGFLNGILATGMAPAIVRSESLMKIWVPSQEIIIDTGGYLLPPIPPARSADIANLMNKMLEQHIKDLELAVWAGSTIPLYKRGPLTNSLINAVANTKIK